MKEINNPKLLSKYVAEHNIIGVFDKEILNHLVLLEYEKNEYLCRDGEIVEYVLFLVQGEVKVYTTLENGKIYLLRIEKPLSVYGDIELLNSDTYCANVEALSNCHVIGISFSYIRKQYLNNSEFLRYLCQSLGDRLMTISQMSTKNLYLPLVNKLASYLMIHRNETTNQVIIRRSFTDISDQLGATYRHLSRTFKTLESGGVIGRSGKSIAILDLAKLEELAGNVYRE
jgi:CRP-like cAMP-binding protein